VPWNDGVQGSTLQFAGSESRLLRALAGPGTGKTFALLRRLMRVIETGVAPEEVLVLTFARTAAVDILTRGYPLRSRSPYMLWCASVPPMRLR
jgi:superfamily I DNA/RNA helicase